MKENKLVTLLLIVFPLSIILITFFVAGKVGKPLQSDRSMYVFFNIALLVLVWFLFVIYYRWLFKSKKEEYMKKMVEDLQKNEEIAKKEMVMAKKVQEGLLAMNKPEIDGINLVARCVPAENIGGDFYAFVNKEVGYISHNDTRPGIIEYRDKMDDYLGIVVGDVAGHGVSSALVMTLASGLLSEIGKNKYSPAKVLGEANVDLRNYISNSDISFVTAFYGLLNLKTGQMTYARAGHVNPIILHASGEYEMLENEGVFLGMFTDEVYKDSKIDITQNDKIIMFTDGITEARNRDGEFYGQERLIDLLVSSKGLPVEELQSKIFDDVNEFSQGHLQEDDRTVVILEYLK